MPLGSSSAAPVTSPGPRTPTRRIVSTLKVSALNVRTGLDVSPPGVRRERTVRSMIVSATGYSVRQLIFAAAERPLADCVKIDFGTPPEVLRDGLIPRGEYSLEC